MRILHTADWHVGRRLRRHERAAETAAALDEVARIADERQVDLVLVSGDVFDRPIPPVDALSLGLRGLLQLAEGRPVVAVAGNHDSPELFDAIAPLIRGQGRGIHLVGGIRRPEEGGILGPDELGVPALVGCLPFLREGRVVDFMRDAGEWYGQYADRVAGLCAAFDAALVARARADLVPVLMAHFMVGGVKVGGSERELHVGGAYVASAQAIPPGPQYVALGHIHAPQPIPGSPVPGRYAGSLLPLDFGEAGETKSVVIVDAEPGRLATLEAVPLRSGRPLIRAQGTWEEIEGRADELRDAYLDLTVRVGGTDTELGRRAADTFPFLVNVRPFRPPRERRPGSTGDVRPSDQDQYADFYRRDTGEEPPDALLGLFREILDEVADATA
jgi:DNA repair protein SbcD/Mre11